MNEITTNFNTQDQAAICDSEARKNIHNELRPAKATK